MENDHKNKWLKKKGRSKPSEWRWTPAQWKQLSQRSSSQKPEKHVILPQVSLSFSLERHRDNEEEREASRDRRGGMGWSDCYGGHYATLCHAVPHRRVTQSWDGDRYNLLLTAMSIKDTSHWTTCISWFLGNLTQFLLSHNNSAHHHVLVPFAECTNGCFSIWFGLQILVTTHDKEKQILYINPNDGDEWEGCLPKAVKIWMHTLKQKVKCKSFQKMQKN